MKIIRNYKNWTVEEGDYVDLYEAGGLRHACLVEYEDKFGEKTVALCGYTLITGFEKELGIESESELDVASGYRDEQGRLWYPVCYYLEDYGDYAEIADWVCDGSECFEKFPIAFSKGE